MLLACAKLRQADKQRMQWCYSHPGEPSRQENLVNETTNVSEENQSKLCGGLIIELKYMVDLEIRSVNMWSL